MSQCRRRTIRYYGKVPRCIRPWDSKCGRHTKLYEVDWYGTYGHKGRKTIKNKELYKVRIVYEFHFNIEINLGQERRQATSKT